MFWGSSRNSDIVVVTTRANHALVRVFLQQLETLRYDVIVIDRVTVDKIRGLPTPQAVIIDAAHPLVQSGESGVNSIRAAWEYVPMTLFVAADELDRLRFVPDLQDFISLPVRVPELDARLRFIMWKMQGAAPTRDKLEVNGLRMDTSTYEVWVGKRKVDLTYKEFELLKYFLQHPRRVYSRAELLEAVWETDFYGGTRTVDVHIRRLREKLGSAVGNMIHTVRNVGYRFG